MTPPGLADSGMAVMQAVPPSALSIEIMHQGVRPEDGMMQSDAGTRRPHFYPPTREQDSLVRLSMMLDDDYCTAELT